MITTHYTNTSIFYFIDYWQFYNWQIFAHFIFVWKISAHFIFGCKISPHYITTALYFADRLIGHKIPLCQIEVCVSLIWLATSPALSWQKILLFQRPLCVCDMTRKSVCWYDLNFQSSTRVALTCMGAVTTNPLISTTAPFRQVNICYRHLSWA